MNQLIVRRAQSISSEEWKIFIFKRLWWEIKASSDSVKVYGKYVFDFKLKQKLILSV